MVYYYLLQVQTPTLVAADAASSMPSYTMKLEGANVTAIPVTSWQPHTDEPQDEVRVVKY